MSHQKNYTPAELNSPAFHCPHCGVYARQRWNTVVRSQHEYGGGHATYTDQKFLICYCEACRSPTFWIADGSMIFPVATLGEPPADDLPDELKRDYEEARVICQYSPRGAAALLRLVIQKLCVHLDQPGKDINKDIGALVAAGLPAAVQKALDIVRVVGNESVHPGTIDLRDEQATALQLFRLVNLIVEKMITEPREIEDLYAGLPPNKLDGIHNSGTVARSRSARRTRTRSPLRPSRRHGGPPGRRRAAARLGVSVPRLPLYCRPSPGPIRTRSPDMHAPPATRFTLEPRRWYAAELIGDEFGNGERSYAPHRSHSPIRVDAVRPAGGGHRRFELEYYHANYPEGVRQKTYILQTVERGERYIPASSKDHGPVRLMLIYAVDWRWMQVNFGVAQPSEGRTPTEWLEQHA